MTDKVLRLNLYPNTEAFGPGPQESNAEIAEVLRSTADAIEDGHVPYSYANLYDRDDNPVGVFRMRPIQEDR